MKKGGGFGLLMLVIVVAIVLYLWASSAKEAVPTLTGAEQELEAIAGSGELPNVQEMEQATADHAAELQEALEATNQ